MTGEHLARLRKAVAPMNHDDVLESRKAWSSGYTNLDGVARALERSRDGIRNGFGADSDITRTALEAIANMQDKVNNRKGDMYDATLALDDLLSAMAAAKGVATEVSGATDPGDPPKFPTVTSGDEADEIQAMKVHNAQTRAYNARAASYAADDAEAERALRDLNTAYDAAIPVFAKIHGEPVEEPRRTPTGTSPGGIPSGVRPPTYTPPPGGLIGVDDNDPRDPDFGDPGDDDTKDPDFPDIDPGDPRDPGTIDPGDPGGPGGPGGPGIGNPGGPGGTGGPGGINPGLVGGGLLAGGLVGPGAINGIRGLLSRGGLSSGAPAIGASTRAGGPGSLGRGGLAPGSQVGRGAGGRGAGGRGAGGRGVPGSQGGRGGRGAAGAAGGRGGRRKDGEREGADQELYDDGQDWLDDEGTAPGVLG